MHSQIPTKLVKPKKYAGGIPAMLSSFRHSFREMGILRAFSQLLKVNQKQGFDCPGCAWPDPEDPSMVEFCENGAKAVAEEATKKRVELDFWRSHSLPDLQTKDEFYLGKQGRILEPVYRHANSDHYEPISWESAFELIANKLRSLPDPNSAAFYTSGRASNEAAFLYQLFVRSFGTNNLPDCSNMCHESSGVGLKETIGIGKGTVKLEDFDLADCIIVMGQNPGTNHPRMLSALQNAARNKAEIIHINPLPEAGMTAFIHPQEPLRLLGPATKIATQFLPVRINGDVALLKGIMKFLLEWDSIDPDFIQTKTNGFAEFRSGIEKTSWEDIIEGSGIEKVLIKQVARTVAKSKRLIVCWAMGLTQHKNAVANIQEIVNLLLLGGHFGRPGAGACPVRGHSNVQGDRTVGIWEAAPAPFIEPMEKRFGLKLPREHGLNTVQTIQGMLDGSVRVFVALGGNLLSAGPDTHETASALEKCDLTVHISTKPNRTHAFAGKESLILPCLARSDADIQSTGPQFVTVENSMGYVHKSQGKLKPASNSMKSEVAIVCEIAKRVLGEDAIPWSAYQRDYSKVRHAIEDCIAGFKGYNQKILDAGGFYLPNPIRDHAEFLTDDKKAVFTQHPLPIWSLKKTEFLMMTIRTHDQYNTTIYGLDDRYRGILGGRRAVLINESDCESAGWQSGDLVNLRSQFNGKIRESKGYSLVPYSIPKGCVATYFPEANELIPLDSFADKSFTPTSKSIVVTIEKAP